MAMRRIDKDEGTPAQLLVKSFSIRRSNYLFFYTSNLAKFLQARVVFARSGLVLQHFRSKTDPYNEDYSAGKEVLLERAIQEIVSSVGASSLFFVEDTSLRLESLSTSSDDFPGLTVKEWFAQATFGELDRSLREKGNDRRAVIKSDIALHVPGLIHPCFFTEALKVSLQIHRQVSRRTLNIRG